MTSEGEPEIIIVADRDALATEAAERIARALTEAVDARGRADWATTGGSLAVPIYRRLAETPLRDHVPWHAVHTWWGDDRYVPRDHPLSNVKPFDEILLAIGWTEEGQAGLGTVGQERPIPQPIGQLHRFPTTEAIAGTRGAAWCAERLGEELGDAGLSRHGQWPIFDLVLLGIGSDAHLLSVFPGSAAFDSSALALAIPAPTHIEPHVERVTLNPALLGVARRLIAVTAGSEKSAAVAATFGSERDPRRWPAQLARRPGATWILDAEAAADLADEGAA